MSIHRKLISVYKPAITPGFLGAGHTARQVVGNNFVQSDPFIILMDDMLDKQDSDPVGGPHPHAGFETVTLMLEGEIGDGEHTLKEGDLQMMTAGRGVIHTETIDKKKKLRLLQLWINLPNKDKWVLPRVQDISADRVPSISENGTIIKVYCGSFAGLTSPISNYAPLIIADIHLESGTTMKHEIPASYTTFLYVIQGNLEFGEERKDLHESQIGWLDSFPGNAGSQISLIAGGKGTRFILYSAQPSNEEIVSHGPFIASSSEDMHRLFKSYNNNEMKHISTLPAEQKMVF